MRDVRLYIKDLLTEYAKLQTFTPQPAHHSRCMDWARLLHEFAWPHYQEVGCRVPFVRLSQNLLLLSVLPSRKLVADSLVCFACGVFMAQGRSWDAQLARSNGSGRETDAHLRAGSFCPRPPSFIRDQIPERRFELPRGSRQHLCFSLQQEPRQVLHFYR